MSTIVADGQCVSFDRFMEWALYAPEAGYYRQPPESVLGASGDYFTASQLQPMFGEIIASLLPDEPVLELGPGRGEMQSAFLPRPYRSLQIDDPLPSSWTGIVFANEFFDALPVAAGIRKNGELLELLVERHGSRYTWQTGAQLSSERKAYVEKYLPDLQEGARFEIAERAMECIRRISECLQQGVLMIIDYGWSGHEYLRFPEGTLMGYRKHRALPAVLENPGRQDITAHVPFQALIDAARNHGFTVLRFETLAQTLLRALERMPRLPSDARSQAQLKTLLFGMGEMFRVLLLHKAAGQ